MGWTYAGRGMASPAYNASLGIADAPLTPLRWEIDRERASATSHLGHTIPVRPFLGTIGLSPAVDHASGWLPTASGGNMDCRELIAGTTLYLPVQVPERSSPSAMATPQGDGEFSGTAIECPMETATLRLTRRDLRIAAPRQEPAGVDHAGLC